MTESESEKKLWQLSDFKILNKIGEGAFGKVYLVQETTSGQNYALKYIEKQFISEQGKDHYVFLEKLILANLQNSHIVKLYGTFQDERRLYFLLEYVPNKEVSKVLAKKSSLNREVQSGGDQIRGLGASCHPGDSATEGHPAPRPQTGESHL